MWFILDDAGRSWKLKLKLEVEVVEVEGGPDVEKGLMFSRWQLKDNSKHFTMMLAGSSRR